MTMEFMGYLRPDGKVGSRNYVGVIPSVTCANDVAQAICRQVQGTVTFLHHQGCCQMPPDLERVTDTLISLGHSPNLAAILIVSLGCEGTDHERMYDELCRTGKHVEIIHIQELGGVSKAIQAGTDIARRMVIEVSALQRQPVDISNVIMSIKCGASDTTSGMASNCVIGYVADKLVDLGATVIFGETTEFLGGEHLLARRAVSKEVGDKILEIVTAMENRAKSIGCDMRKGQPTPGNIAGGLSSIEEKSLGAIVKSGTRPIQGVMDYTEHVTNHKGLWIKDNPRPRAGDPHRHGRDGRAVHDVLHRPGSAPGLPQHAGHQDLRQPQHLPAHGGGHGRKRRAHHHRRKEHRAGGRGGLRQNAARAQRRNDQERGHSVLQRNRYSLSGTGYLNSSMHTKERRL